MFDPEKGVLMCFPCNMDDLLVVEGSLREKCCKCGTKIWVTPASMEAVQEKDLQLMCMDCVLVVKALEEPDIAMPTEAQMRELLKAISGQN